MALAAAADERLGDTIHAESRHQASFAIERLQRVLQREAIYHGGQHSHVVSRGFLNAGVARDELGAAEDVAAADDDGDFNTELRGPLCLRGDIDDLLHANAALARRGKTFAREF